MKPWINIARITFIEVAQSRLFQTLLVLTLVAPLFGFVLSSLFLVDIGKVYLDGVLGISHVLSICFVLFVAAGLLARDIEQKVCYLLVLEPSSRTTYLLGRFAGLALIFFLLMMLVILEGALVGHFYIGAKDITYQSGYAWQNLAMVVFLHTFQYLALLGFVFFVFSWATGVVEIMLFSSAGLLLSWIFPPILLAMQNQDVSAQVPVQVQAILEFLYNMLPHLNGGTIALTLVHGQALATSDTILYMMEHIGYAGLMLFLACFLFARRDL